MSDTVCFTGFSDMGEMWRNDFETDNFVEEMQALWTEVEPLYLELHTYVKNKLKEVYGDLLGDDDLIPAHILGSLYSCSIRPLSLTSAFCSICLLNILLQAQ
jgi:peptidyl-dipeptidase A